MADIAVIIVTHNSEAVLDTCIGALDRYGGSCFVCIVDSGSRDTSYLASYEDRPGFKVLRRDNIGFSQANNLGCRSCPKGAEYIVFLNPDAFICADTFSLAETAMEADSRTGCLSGRLAGYDSRTMQPTGRLDSTGIFRTWYGRWYDRGQGEPDHGQYSESQVVPAACGAFLFCRRTMLEQVALDGGAVFDPDFFLYKEDIELSLRIHKTSWRIRYLPDILVYHCRGWQQRQLISRRLRITAAAGEILLYKKHPSPYMVWALTKYLLVRFVGL